MSQIDASGLLAAEEFLRFHDLRTAPGYSDLTVWVDGAERSDEPGTAETGNAGIDRMLGPVHRIDVVPGSLRYEVIFADFIAFQVRNESFVLPEPNEDFSTHLRRYEKSAFLDHVRATTMAEGLVDGPLMHIAVVTLDQVIDVATTVEPVITARVIGPDDPGKRPDLPDDHG
jgi:hypothetical protein